MNTTITVCEIDNTVNDYINSNRITLESHYMGASKNKDGWASDNWNIFISKGSQRESFEFHAGIGQRVLLMGRHLSKRGRDTIQSHNLKVAIIKTIYHQGRLANECAVSPTAASVLHCLLADGRAASGTFEDFCSELGHDEDSRKALELYLACQKNGNALIKILGNTDTTCLENLLEDY